MRITITPYVHHIISEGGEPARRAAEEAARFYMEQKPYFWLKNEFLTDRIYTSDSGYRFTASKYPGYIEIYGI